MHLKLYHGTTKDFSRDLVTIPNAIDRTKCGGELGMGFYLGDNLGMAVIFAKGRYGNNSGVVQFDIKKTEFAKLELYLIKLRQKVFLKWKWIIGSDQRLKYLFKKDVVIAPFATVDFGVQYKFESVKAETLLNVSNKIVIL